MLHLPECVINCKTYIINKIISEKTFDKITGWYNEKDKEKDDYER